MNAMTEAEQLRARIAELERLLAPAAPDAGVLTVSYSDGRVKYAAADGNKYPVAADAILHNRVLVLMQLGATEAIATTLAAHSDEVVAALSP